MSELPKLVLVDRRTTLRWLAAATAAGQIAACSDNKPAENGLVWPEPPTAIVGKGYGKDPNLIEPSVPWPLTLTKSELIATAALVDLILPADGGHPSASQVGVPAFIDEWVSAPYPDQQEHRALILPGLAWLDAEANARGKQKDGFAYVDETVRIAIAEDIAFKDRVKPGYEKPAEFFARMRALTLGAYYTTPEGWKAIGYPGAKPGKGMYQGPTPEALAHIKGVVEDMGLKFAMPENGVL
jgi:hypothetical protein